MATSCLYVYSNLYQNLIIVNLNNSIRVLQSLARRLDPLLI